MQNTSFLLTDELVHPLFACDFRLFALGLDVRAAGSNDERAGYDLIIGLLTRRGTDLRVPGSGEYVCHTIGPKTGGN